MKIEDACPTCGALCEVDLDADEEEYVAIDVAARATAIDPGVLHRLNDATKPIDAADRNLIIRALKSQQDAAIEAKPVGQSLWQPIETAPKTGRTLLLGYPNSLGNWRTVRGEWLTQDYIDQNWEEPDEAEAGWYETSVEADDGPSCWPITPTHWQPLPKPPVAAAIESQRSGDGS